jgi:hypothetical protein
MDISKTWMALKKLDKYLAQQRKLGVVIWTNDETMQKLIKSVHPSMTIELIKTPYEEYLKRQISS